MSKTDNVSTLWIQFANKNRIPDNYSENFDDNSLSPEEKDFCGTMLGNIKETFNKDLLRFWLGNKNELLFKKIEKVVSGWKLEYRVVVLSKHYDDLGDVLKKILNAVLDQYAPYQKSSWYFNKNVRHYILDNVSVKADKVKWVFWITFG